MVGSPNFKLLFDIYHVQIMHGDLIRRELIDVKEDGSYRLHMKYFSYPYGLRMTGEPFNAKYLADSCNQAVEQAWAEAQAKMAAAAQRAPGRAHAVQRAAQPGGPAALHFQRATFKRCLQRAVVWRIAAAPGVGCVGCVPCSGQQAGAQGRQNGAA